MSRPVLLQLCPLSGELEARISELFAVHRYFALGAPDTWLAEHASAVIAVATGGNVGISNALLQQLPNLRVVAINGVGFDKVDLTEARRRGVRVTNTPDVLTDDVADLAVGLTISLLRSLPQADQFVRSGDWLQGERPLTRKVSGRRVGIVGLGRIGLAIAQRLSAFGAVSYFGRQEKAVPYPFHASLGALAQQSDVLIVSVSAGADSYGMIDREVLQALGPEGYLVNVARGSVVDENALIAALQTGAIAGAALDVFADEPRVPQTLIDLPNVVLTPHIASATVETRRRMADLVVENLKAFLDGAPLPTPVV